VWSALRFRPTRSLELIERLAGNAQVSQVDVVRSKIAALNEPANGVVRYAQFGGDFSRR
jgi:hypothetical protein